MLIRNSRPCAWILQNQHNSVQSKIFTLETRGNDTVYMQIYPRLLSAYKTKVRINKSLIWGGYYFVYPAGWTWNITTRFAVKHLNEIDLHEKKK